MLTTPECLDLAANPKRIPPLTIAISIYLKPYNDNKQEGWQRISLFQPTRATKEAKQSAIYQNGKTHRRNTMHHPRASFLLETASPQ
jgi:hypothetical protein